MIGSGRKPNIQRALLAALAVVSTLLGAGNGLFGGNAWFDGNAWAQTRASALQAPSQGSSVLGPGGGAAPGMAVPGPTLMSPGGGIAPIAQAPLAQPPSLPPQAVPNLRPGEGALLLAARFGRDLPAITGGLQWRIYPNKPDQTGVFRLLKEDKSAQPTVVLPNGNYIVHVTLGLASAAKPVQVRNEASREIFELPAGGLTIKGQVGDVRIPTGQISFDVFRGSQFDSGEKRPIASNVLTGEVLLVPDGTYSILSKYGDGNAVVRSDIRVQTGKLTDVTVTHRAAAIMLKLVSKKGGEALANTDWAVLSPAGDVITETRGAFPRVILAEGEYKVIARSDNKTYQQDLKVNAGVDGEIEVMAR